MVERFKKIIIKLLNENIGITEYGYGFWIKWSMVYPDKII
jgi:hypothetical protein